MALILKDRVQETSTTTGTGTLTLAGAVTQFQTFSSAVGNGNTTYYTIYNAGGTQWEVGIGTVGAGTLARTTVLASSNAGSLVNFTGTLYVFGDYPADKAVFKDSSGNVTGYSLSGGTINGASIGASVAGDGYFDGLFSNFGAVNGSLGATTPNTAKVTTLDIGTELTLNTAPGTTGQVLTSAGAGNLPTWSTPTTGTVTSVTGTSPVVSSGGTTPAISMPAATSSVNGYLTSADWTTFNSKGSGSVTSVNLTASTGISVSGGPITSSGSITVTNTAPMTYPGAGIGNSTGSAWGTSYTTSGTGTVIALATAPALNTPVVTNYTETLYAPAAGSSFTISLANGTVQEISLNANGTITLPSSVAGKSFVIIVTYSGAYTLTWAGGSTIKWPGGTAPTASSASGKYDIFTFFQDGTNTYGNSFGLNY